MPTIIDALVITLGLDPSEFKKGSEETTEEMKRQKKEAERLAKDMEAAGKRASSFFSGIRNQIIALAGVTLSLKGIENFMSSFSSKLNDLSIASNAFGMKAKNLDGWIQAGKAFGVSAQEIVASFSKISDAQEKLKAGRGKDQILTDIQRFSNMTGAGIDIMNDSAEAVNRKIEANFSKLSAEQQRAFGMELGRGYAWQKWSATGHSVNDIDETTKNSGVNEVAIKAAERMRAVWAKLSQTLEKIGYIIYTELEPHLEDFYKWLAGVAEWMAQNPQKIKSAIDGIFDAISKVCGVANDAAKAVGGWENAIALLIGASVGFKLLGFLSTLTMAFRGIFALSPPAWVLAGVGLSYQAYKGIDDAVTKKDGTSSLWDSIKKRWGAGGWYNATNGDPEQHAQSAKRPRAIAKGKQLLDWMGGQFAQLEQKYNLPDGILRSIATAESGGNQFAISGAGAKGLFQFMDPTAKDMGLKGNDVFDPEKSASAAAKYLSQLLQQTGGNLQEAIAAYNWGIGNVQKKGLGMAPAETRNYVPKVLAGMQVGAAANAQSHINSNVTNSTTSDSNVYNIGKVQVGADVKNVSDIMTDAKQKIGRSSLVTAYATGVSG